MNNFFGKVTFQILHQNLPPRGATQIYRCAHTLELAPVPCDREGALRVREADPRAHQREALDFLLLLQRVVVSSEQELHIRKTRKRGSFSVRHVKRVSCLGV